MANHQVATGPVGLSDANGKELDRTRVFAGLLTESECVAPGMEPRASPSPQLLDAADRVSHGS